MIFLSRKKNLNQLRNRKKRNFIYLIVSLFLICGVFIFIFYFILFSNFFKVNSVKIKGLKMVSKNELLANIKSNLISRGTIESLLGPENILFWKINSGNIRFDNLISKISSVSANVGLRGKNVVILVNERKLYGIQCISNSECYAFDKSGTIFSKAPSLEGVLLINVKNLNSKRVFLGAKIFPKDKWIENFFKTLDIIEKNDIPVKTSIIKDYKLREWEAVLADGFSMYFSFNFVPENLNNVLKNLASRVNFEDLSYIDFRIPNRLFYK